MARGTGSLRPVPERPPRVLGLVRVSKERDGMVSPEVQRASIEDYSAHRGYQITGWMEGLDESGSRARSAWWQRLDQGVASVEAGEYDVLVVWKFSRVARHRLRWAVAIDRVESAGGTIESATEQVDTRTSTGRLTRGMLGELNAWQAEMTGDVWRDVHARRVRAGLPSTGKPKWGYAYDRDQQLHVPDPVTGPALASIYRRYTAGESVYALARWLNAHGHRTLAGGLWSDRTLRRVLDSGFASGRFLVRGELHQGVHDALITDTEWQAYLDARARRRAAPARRERSQYVLSGLVRCARCGHSMVAGQFGAGRQPKYRCKVGKEQGPEACGGGYVMAAYLEREVLAFLGQLATEVEVRRAARSAARAKQVVIRSDVRVLARRLKQAEESLGRLALQNAESPLPTSVYRSARDELAGRADALRGEVEELERVGRRAQVNAPAVAKTLLEEWERRPVAQRRELLGQLVSRIEVTTGRPRAHVVVVPAFEG